ncbi:MAG TPA: hypothetical protein VIM10_16135 [Actinopolymorphaceae bacterium]|jgi:hypothetical protein
MATTTPTLTERAAKARAEADRLDAQAIALKREDDAAQRALTERRRLPYEAAVATATRAALAAVDSPKDEPRPWAEVLADPSVDLNGLFVAWCELRAISASRAAVVQVGGNLLDSNDPRHDDDGNLVPWRRDTQDRMEGALFLPAIEQAIEMRTKAAATAAGQAVAQATQDAGSTAASKVK